MMKEEEEGKESDRETERWRDGWRRRRERRARQRPLLIGGASAATQGCRVYRPPPSLSFTLFLRRPVHPTLHLCRLLSPSSLSTSRSRLRLRNFFRPGKSQIFDAC